MNHLAKNLGLFLFLFSVLCLLGGCSDTVENAQALNESKLPWGRPADWETTMPVGPGINY